MTWGDSGFWVLASSVSSHLCLLNIEILGKIHLRQTSKLHFYSTVWKLSHKLGQEIWVQMSKLGEDSCFHQASVSPFITWKSH